MEGVATELQQVTLDTQLTPKLKILNERATLFKITSSAMMNACNQYLELTQTQVYNLYVDMFKQTKYARNRFKPIF